MVTWWIMAFLRSVSKVDLTEFDVQCNPEIVQC